jgi:UDP-glucuronate decarboxylase
VVSNFIVQALKGDPITIYGDGSQTRSFCFVDDLIDAFLRLMKTDREVTGPVNLGNPGEFTIAELAERVVELVGSSAEIVYQPLPQDDPLQRRPDLTLADQLLDWRPKVNLEDGLRPVIDYFRGVLNSG